MDAYSPPTIPKPIIMIITIKISAIAMFVGFWISYSRDILVESHGLRLGFLLTIPMFFWSLSL